MSLNKNRMKNKLKDAASILKNARQQLEEAQAKYDEIEKIIKNGGSPYGYVLHFPAECWEKNYLDVIREAKTIEDAKNNLLGYSKIDETQLTYFLEGGNAKVNDVFAIPYFDYKDDNLEKLLPFVVFKIEDGRAFCHCLFSIRHEAFAENNSNDYGKSDIRKVLTKLISCFDSTMISHFQTNNVDWVHPLTDEEKIFEDKFWLLDVAELYTHFKTAESRKRRYLLDKYSGEAGYWWLRQPYADTDNTEYNVRPSGASSNFTAYSEVGLAPACILA